jgi:hypothetical protein
MVKRQDVSHSGCWMIATQIAAEDFADDTTPKRLPKNAHHANVLTPRVPVRYDERERRTKLSLS